LLWFSAGSASYFVVEAKTGRSYAPPAGEGTCPAPFVLPANDIIPNSTKSDPSSLLEAG
jgi:hypothetical protein